MAELWGAIERALGWALAGIFDFIPSYGVAIILLTVGVRVLLIPLTVKQIRSMTAMSKIQPHLKELQRKHKGDRPKLNEEMMKLYKEHNVNPMGGCLPLVAQMPVFIALFAVLRAFITVDVAVEATVAGTTPIPAVYSAEEVPNVVCRPIGSATINELTGLEIRCVNEEDETQDFRVAGFSVRNSEEDFQNLPELISICVPELVSPDEGGTPSPSPGEVSPSPTAGATAEGDRMTFACRSALGTGHLPRDSDLSQDISDERATFLGMRLGCTATQVGSKVTARQCTASEDAAGDLADQIPYYLLIGLIAGSSFWQSHQMAKRAQGQAAQQQKMMTRVMPIMFGFISLSLPAGTNVYFLATNVWTIGQQHLVLKAQEGPKGPPSAKPPKEPPKGSPDGGGPAGEDAAKGQTPKKGHPTPKRKRR
ncbi:MAG TPA: YidC/Oxa1 family membrane protein insertase [Actinomycetota bacterium]